MAVPRIRYIIEIFQNANLISDVIVFTEWINAISNSDQFQAGFLERRFRSEFMPAFNTWLNGSRPNSPDSLPSGSPFVLPEYSLIKYNESTRLENEANQAFNKGSDANENGDQYIAMTVLFATLFGEANNYHHLPLF